MAISTIVTAVVHLHATRLWLSISKVSGMHTHTTESGISHFMAMAVVVKL